MEITQIKVKVATLNKSIFNQIESVKTFNDNEIIGWVNSPNATLILNDGEHLKKVTWLDFWEVLMSRPENKEIPIESVRKNVSDFYHRYPQIFI